MSDRYLDGAYFKVNQIIEDLEENLLLDYIDDTTLNKIKSLKKDLEKNSNNLYELEKYLSGDTSLEVMNHNWII
jgi:hypothetical protein